LECVRERKKIERKLVELRTSPEELARLDERERQEEEQRKKDAETLRAREAEEAKKQKKEDEVEDPYSEEEEEEDEGEGFTVEPHLIPPGKVVLEVDQPGESEEDPEGEEDSIDVTPMTSETPTVEPSPIGTPTFLALSSKREIVPVNSKEEGGGE
jgi:hypothetical protein